MPPACPPRRLDCCPNQKYVVRGVRGAGRGELGPHPLFANRHGCLVGQPFFAYMNFPLTSKHLSVRRIWHEKSFRDMHQARIQLQCL